MSKPAIALFTFFSRTTCGHCKHFKGESTDKDGRTRIDPNSGWEVLTADRELQDLGVEFQLYQFGPEKDPETGQIKQYALEEEFAKRVKGIPHLEMSVPDDPHNYVQFNDPELRGWDAKDSVPVIKRWIIRTLKQEPFKSWRPKAKVARPPEAIMPNKLNQPLVPVQHANNSITAPRVQATPTIQPTLQVTPSQQALIDRQAKQPTMVRQAPTINRTIQPAQKVQTAKIAQPTPKVEAEEEEAESIQDEEDAVSNEDAKDDGSVEQEDEASGEPSQEEIEQPPAPIMVQNRRGPIRPRAPVKAAQAVQSPKPAATTTRGLATQRVQNPTPRPVVQAAAPQSVQTAPPAQPKPKFLPSNWDT